MDLLTVGLGCRICKHYGTEPQQQSDNSTRVGGFAQEIKEPRISS